MVKKLIEEEQGETLTEYALLLFIIAVGMVAVLSVVGTSVNGLYQGVLNRWP
jgi:Flp pilus assembly pilin Flp